MQLPVMQRPPVSCHLVPLRPYSQTPSFSIRVYSSRNVTDHVSHTHADTNKGITVFFDR
jgi:hypothetical protein